MRVTYANGSVNASLQVISLTLNHADISGTIPLALTQGLAINLSRLHLYCNDKLVGTLSSEMGRLTYLDEVFLHKTSVTGTIPSELGHLALLY